MSVVSEYSGRKKRYRYHKSKTFTDFKNREKYWETQQIKFIKRQLIDRGGAVCGICGEPITDMKDCTIDHIRPRSKGGQTTIENCQLAHWECNNRKGDAYDKI